MSMACLRMRLRKETHSFSGGLQPILFLYRRLLIPVLSKAKLFVVHKYAEICSKLEYCSRSCIFHPAGNQGNCVFNWLYPHYKVMILYLLGAFVRSSLLNVSNTARLYIPFRYFMRCCPNFKSFANYAATLS